MLKAVTAPLAQHAPAVWKQPARVQPGRAATPAHRLARSRSV